MFARRITLCLMIAALMLTAVLSGFAFAEEEASLSLDKSEIALALEKGYTFKTTLTGVKAGKYPNYQWSSDQPETVSVNASGHIKALAPGYATVTCELALENGTVLKASCSVFSYKPVTKLGCDIKKAQLNVGQSLQLNTTVKPDEATDPTILFSSSDENVCTVSESGLITAVGAGSCRIVCKPKYGTANEFTVKMTVPSIALDETQITVDSALGVTLSVACYGTEISKLKAVTKDQAVATCELTETGITILPVGVGSTKLILTDSASGSKITAEVSVTQNALNSWELIRVSKVKLSGKTISILSRNCSGQEIISFRWRLRFLDGTGQIVGCTDLAYYARGKEMTENVWNFDKSWKSGNTKTVSCVLPTFGYDSVCACQAALSEYTLSDGSVIAFSEEQLGWYGSDGSSVFPETAQFAPAALTADEQHSASEVNIGWKTRLLVKEHALRLGLSDGGLLVTGFYADSLAEHSGLKIYDVITSINGSRFSEDTALTQRAALWLSRGEALELEIIRNGENISLTIQVP